MAWSVLRDEDALGYLPGFDEDVFISYSHNDDDRYAREDLGWVAQLQKLLEDRIRFHLKTAPRLWRDCEIRNNEDFSSKIVQRLAKTATLLSIVSPSFLDRPWCRRELEEFCRSAEHNGGLQVGVKRRIFKAVKSEVPRAVFPPAFDGTGLYKFYGPDPESPNFVHEFRPSLSEAQWRLYFNQLDSLAKDIAETLSHMRDAMNGGAQPTTPSPGLTVYLAETTSDREEARNQIRRELQDRKIRILPPGDLSIRGNQFVQQVRDYLKESSFSIHLFGGVHGFVPEGLDRPNDWLQHDLALERSKDPDFTRLLWIPAGNVPEDLRQREYLQVLQNDGGQQRNAEILNDSVGALNAEVLRKLEEVQAKRRREKERQVAKVTIAVQQANTASADPRSIYVICDPSDLSSPTLEALTNCLLDNGCEPIKLLPGQEPEELRRMHDEYLTFCDACIIYYGNAPENWVTTKLADFLRVRGKRQSPMLAKAVFAAPPRNEAKAKFRSNQARVILCGDSFEPALFEEFFSAIKGPGNN